ncbi:SAM-dependent methyltransferase [Nocardia sp. NPDC050630]|uniref:SAM-dependent methyltransferase n=1 Tax=Nocardia sp. NPDC050630 TaxID=3364321 RepID=UPI00378DF3C1
MEHEPSLDVDAEIVGMTQVTIYSMESRLFLMRTMRFMAGEVGIRQFLMVGTRWPEVQSTYEIVRTFAPEAKLVYTSDDPLVLDHVQALLTTDDRTTTCISSDLGKPERIISEVGASLDTTEPIGVMFMGTLGHIPLPTHMLHIVRTIMAAMPSSSYLALWDGTTDSQSYVALCEEYARASGMPYYPRVRDEIRAAFDGFELVDPGFVSIAEWTARPASTSQLVSAYGGVARKP